MEHAISKPGNRNSPASAADAGAGANPAGPILFAGDPHGNFRPIVRACEGPPGTLVLLGDCDCAAPLPVILAPILARGWDVRWILGNHDTETEALFDNVASAFPAGDMGLRVVQAGPVRLAGLPGVFKPRVWHPRPEREGGEVEGPQVWTRAEFLAAIGPSAAWRGGLPLWHRDTIFPEDFDALRAQTFDVLVSHEAPSSHRHGFPVIDELARACGARLIVHGHHHESYQATLPGGIAVRGLGVAETWPLP